MIYAGVTKDDERVKTAVQWIRNNYTVDANPGMPPQQDQRGLYYYYHTMGKTLDLLGDDSDHRQGWQNPLLAERLVSSISETSTPRWKLDERKRSLDGR